MLYGCAEPGSQFPDWGRLPVDVEIGPGRGAFALDHAALHPERLLVAIETRRADCAGAGARAGAASTTGALSKTSVSRGSSARFVSGAIFAALVAMIATVGVPSTSATVTT